LEVEVLEEESLEELSEISFIITAVQIAVIAGIFDWDFRVIVSSAPSEKKDFENDHASAPLVSFAVPEVVSAKS
jgi:hypothetical protein